MNKRNRLLRQQGLLENFSHQVGDYYEEKKVGDEWYIKQWNGGTNRWQVAVYSNTSYRNYKGFASGEVRPKIDNQKAMADIRASLKRLLNK